LGIKAEVRYESSSAPYQDDRRPVAGCPSEAPASRSSK
jgi:hypothetical protein